jgi:hypothetical protein
VIGLRTSTLRTALAGGLVLALWPAAAASAQSMTMPEIPQSEAISGQYHEVSAKVDAIVAEASRALPANPAAAAQTAVAGAEKVAVTPVEVTRTESDTPQYQTPDPAILVSAIEEAVTAPAQPAMRTRAHAPTRVLSGGSPRPARRHRSAPPHRPVRVSPPPATAERLRNPAPAAAAAAPASWSPAPASAPAPGGVVAPARPRTAGAVAREERAGSLRRPARERRRPHRDDGGPAPPTPSAPGAAPGGSASAGSGSGFAFWAAVLLAAPILFVPSLRRRFRSGPGRRPPGPLVMRLERPG